ncbi:MAG: exo 1,3/1,4-beta-D-glucan glucohydrolase [Gammaproteobacteria bacterium]|nr:exo 1,3/1,4-beta-D-glucan glucohydrolase [Gammaproteobacteria bacterium]
MEAWPEVRHPLPRLENDEELVASLLAMMSVEEKVGQVIQAEIRHATPDDVRAYHLGSILNGGGSFPNQDKYASLDDWLALADAYYEASMDAGDGRQPIPVIWGTDAVHGHANVRGATVFPHNIGLGAMHHPELMRDIGESTAREVRATGIDWTFAPSVAVAQDDRWGRTYESYSEDPDEVRAYAREIVLGLQGRPGEPDFLGPQRVVATAKHFLGDGATESGDDQGDAQVSEEELRDVHVPGYLGSLEAGVQSVMASFSSWNGAKMHGNRYLLTDVLKKRMGFDGLVIGDWNGHGQIPGCTNASCPAAINAGLDLFMVVDDWKALYENTLEQVNSGDIPMARLDDAVSRVLRVKVRAGLFDRGRPSERAAGLRDAFGHPDHRAVARQAVRESLVLIKNENKLLPIGPGRHVLVAGEGADDIGKQSGGWTISWQGTGNVNSDFPHGTSILDGLREAVGAIGGTVEFSVEGKWTQQPDVAIVVYGENPYAEYQGDLPTLEFEPGNKRSLPLLEQLGEAGIPVVSVFLTGRPLWISREINASNAFVVAWLPGSEGSGVADVLVGDENGEARHDFRGRLSFSWPGTPLQFRLNPHHEPYEPLFELGYGLTYASGETGPANIDAQVSGIQPMNRDSIDLYSGRLLPPWAVFITPEGSPSMMLSGSLAAHASGAITVRTADRAMQEDSLNVRFSGSKPAAVQITGPGLDLGEYLEEGILSFMFLQEQPAEGALRLGVGGALIDLSVQSAAWVGQSWQQLSVPVSCFADNAESLVGVNEAFRIESTGKAEVSFGEVRFLKTGRPNLSCE